MKKAIKYNLIALALISLSFSVYALWKVECPFCHADNLNAQGECEMGSDCPNRLITENAGGQLESSNNQNSKGYSHYEMETCPWCRATGKMSNLEIFLD